MSTLHIRLPTLRMTINGHWFDGLYFTNYRGERRLRDDVKATVLVFVAFASIIILTSTILKSNDDNLPTLILDGADRIVAVRTVDGKVTDDTTEIRKWIGNSSCPREYW
jgi:hypothetical protein